MHRSVPLADGVSGTGLDSLGNIRFSFFKGCLNVMVPGHIAGNRGRQRTAGAMVVAGLDTLALQRHETIFGGILNEGRIGAGDDPRLRGVRQRRGRANGGWDPRPDDPEPGHRRRREA